MKREKVFAYATLLALPLIGLLFYYLNPPQCPDDYTQVQIDGAHCIVGANIGGLPLFFVTTPVVWLAAVGLWGWSC